MKQCQGMPIKKSLFLAYPPNKQLSLKTLLKENFEQFFSYLRTINLEITHKEQTINMQNNSTTTLRFPISCFKVDFNDSFVTITAIKK